VLNSTLPANAAEARGFRGGSQMSSGGSVHMGGRFGGRVGNMGGEHAMYRFMRGYALSCYYPDEAPKAPPWPPFCN
jgi:hypothetical protein